MFLLMGPTTSLPLLLSQLSPSLHCLGKEGPPRPGGHLCSVKAMTEISWAVVEVIEPHRRGRQWNDWTRGLLQMTPISFNFNLISTVIVHSKLRRRHPRERLRRMNKI